MPYRLEPIGEEHREAVVEIFNYHVVNGFAAYPDEPVGEGFFDRLREIARGYPAVVASDDSAVVGFGLLHSHHFAATLRRTAEIGYFLLPAHTRRGLGTAMLRLLIEKARSLGIDSVLASISSLNEPSLRFHLKNGFRPCGCFRRVGRKHGQDFDVVWMQSELT